MRLFNAQVNLVRQLPGPWSFVGELITLVWAIEAVVEPGDHAARIEIAVSPTGRPIRLAGTPGAVAAG